MPIFRARNWMWAEAMDALERVERIHTKSFEPRRHVGGRASWEPPVDMLETNEEVLILISLPGVDPEKVVTTIEDGVLIIVGQRILPPELRTAVIHRLELPQGCFERRLPLPPGRYDGVRRIATNGCLYVGLHKSPAPGARR
jgi:HSP20 family molecular chaperone IbpA